MTALVKEEISHFKMVHDKIIERGWVLGRDRRDDYVLELLKFFPKGGSRTTQLVHRLLYAALIEARSCERFKVLSDNIKDQKLSVFYREFMISESNHYTSFLNFARVLAEEGYDVKKRWEEWLEFEAKVIASYGKSETIHG